MKSWKHALITYVILGALAGCISSEGSAEKFIASGKSLMAEGDFDKARLEFRNAIQIQPKNAEAYYQLALIDEKSQNWKGMFVNLSQVEQLAPTYYEAIVKLGQIHLLAGDFDIALEKADKVLVANNKHVMANVLRASTSMKQGNLISALNDIERALVIEPQNIEAISLKSLVLNQQGKLDEALVVLESALMAKPDELPLTMIKLSILERQKKYTAMEEVYSDLLTSQPDANWVLVSLAKLLNMQDRYADAKRVISHFIESHPADAQAKLLLVSLVETKEPEQAITLLNNYIAQDKADYELRLSKVQLLLASDQVELAIADLNELAQLDPEGNSGRKALVALAGIKFQQGDLTTTTEILKRVLKVAAEDESALLLKTRIDIINKDIDTAVTNLRIVLRNNPESDQALVLLAQAYMNSGSVELADDKFRQALTINPSNTIAALSVANSLIKTNDLNRTEVILVKSLKQNPNNEAILQALAQVRILKKDWLGTEKVVNSLKADTKDSALAHYFTARISQGQEYYNVAIEEYKSALALRPDMTRALQGLAYSYIKLEQKQPLLDYLTEYLAKNPNFLAGYVVLSNVYVQDKAWDKAIASLEDGLKVDPKWQGGYSAIASIYYAQDMSDKAINSYQRGLDNIPDSNFLSLQLATAFERNGDYDKAKSLYEVVLAKDANIELAINNLASLLTDQFSSEENLQKALVLSSRFNNAIEPYYLDTYGWVNVKLGNLDKAQILLERVVFLSPNVALFNYHLGALYQKQGAMLDADKYLKTAKELAVKQNDTVTKAEVEELLSKL